MFVFCLGGSHLNANSEESVVVPEGWRLPQYNEIVYPTDLWRKEGEYVKAIADFNGDGLVDHVFLLVRKDVKGWGLFVFMGKIGKAEPPIQLDSSDDLDQLKVMGIELEMDCAPETGAFSGVN